MLFRSTPAATPALATCWPSEPHTVDAVELIDLIPNSMSFRVVTTIDVADESEIPEGFTGRVKHHLGGSVVYVAWFVQGQLNNPSRTHPAYRRFRSDGRLKYEMFYSQGALHDPSASTPAVRGFYANGQVHYEERYFGGRRHDATDGTAAIRKWRLDGSLRHELHYADGNRIEAGAVVARPRTRRPPLT